jgi:hypothetical protein
MNQYRCDKTCKHYDDSDEENRTFDLIFCKKYLMDIEPVFRGQSVVVGCASHSDFQKEREFAGEPALTEIEIALRKEESPSENVQWAIERLNQVQGYLEEAMTLCIVAERASEREKVLKRMLECISQYEMLPNRMDFVIEDLLEELRGEQ